MLQRTSTARAATRGSTAGSNLYNVAVVDILNDSDGGPDERSDTSILDEDRDSSLDMATEEEVVEVTASVSSSTAQRNKRPRRRAGGESTPDEDVQLSDSCDLATSSAVEGMQPPSAGNAGTAVKARGRGNAAKRKTTADTAGKAGQAGAVPKSTAGTRGKARGAGAAPKPTAGSGRKSRAAAAKDLNNAIARSRIRIPAERRKLLSKIASEQSAKASAERERAYAASMDRRLGRASFGTASASTGEPATDAREKSRAIASKAIQVLTDTVLPHPLPPRTSYFFADDATSCSSPS